MKKNHPTPSLSKNYSFMSNWMQQSPKKIFKRQSARSLLQEHRRNEPAELLTVCLNFSTIDPCSRGAIYRSYVSFKSYPPRDLARLGKAPFCSGLHSLPTEHGFELIWSLITVPETIQVLMVSLSAFNEHFLWIVSLHCFIHLLTIFDHQFR